MKTLSKLFSVILVLTLIVASVPAVSAAGTEPGKTAYATFSFDGVYGIDGTFTYSNSAVLTGITYSDSGTMNGKVKNDMAYYYASEATGFSINVAAMVSASAKNGDSCTITFTYRTSDADGNMSEWKSMSRTVSVEVHTCADSNNDHKCDGCGKVLTNCENANGDHLCDVCGGRLTDCTDSNRDQKCDICDAFVALPIDYTSLNQQLDIAAGLNEKDYTADSWADFVEAWDAAKDAQKATKQDDVDAAAKALADAIAALKRMDYSKLQAALDSVKDLGKDAGLGDLIDRLVAAIEAGKIALESNDQARVDAAAKELEDVIAALKKALEEMKTTETIVEKVPVPTDPFCNISWHNLLIVSAVLNVVFIVVIVASLLKKKKNRNDTTPLVNCNADDE